ncbi:hypothetical protein H6G34_20270 [Anabaena variabilis FACHB-171]|nr:hypothetical protein [Trichormus variabilis FACHB-171]MBD2351205.1 hypothetical protein [Trichormus variabilis FACHB-171]
MEKALQDITSGDNQWIAIRSHAQKYQASHVALYITFRRFDNKAKTDFDILGDVLKAQKNALGKGVILFMLNIFD